MPQIPRLVGMHQQVGLARASLHEGPDFLAAPRRAVSLPRMLQGIAPQVGRGEVLERLSHDFELCVYGLGEVRREWERREPESPAGPIENCRLPSSPMADTVKGCGSRSPPRNFARTTSSA